MSNQLIPQKRLDKNGQAVTRWVKVLGNGEPGIKIPAPQSPALRGFAETALQNLFPSVEEDSGYLIDLVGAKWYYSADFVKHALEVLPPKTLRKLSETVTGEKTAAQKYLSLQANQYLTLMYGNREADNVQEMYDASVAWLSNALTFHEVLDNLTSMEAYYVSGEDFTETLNQGLYQYEVTTGVREKSQRGDFDTRPSTINYAQLPVRKQKEASAFMIASRLTREFTSERGLPDKELIKFVYDHLDRQREVIDLVKERGADDVQVLASMMNSETPAISSGML
jgi:hypothetical protein